MWIRIESLQKRNVLYAVRRLYEQALRITPIRRMEQFTADGAAIEKKPLRKKKNKKKNTKKVLTYF